LHLKVEILENARSYSFSQIRSHIAILLPLFLLTINFIIPNVSQRAVETGAVIVVKPTTGSTECLLQQILQQGTDSAKPFPV